MLKATETVGLFVDMVKTNEYAKFYTFFFPFLCFCFHLFLLPLEYGAYIFFNLSNISPEDALGVNLINENKQRRQVW